MTIAKLSMFQCGNDILYFLGIQFMKRELNGSRMPRSNINFLLLQSILPEMISHLLEIIIYIYLVGTAIVRNGQFTG